MKLKDIFKNTLWFGIIPRLTILINLIVTPLITPYLSQVDYGMWGIISAYVGLITGFATLGLHIHLTNSYYEYGRNFKLVWRRLMYFMMLGAFGCFFITFLLLLIELPNTETYNIYFVAFLSCIPILLNFNIVAAQHYYNIVLLPKPIVTRTLTGSVCGILVLFISVYFFRLGYLGYILSSFVSSLVVFLLLIKPFWLKLQLYPMVSKYNSRVKFWFKTALPMIPHNVGHIILSSSSRILLAFFAIPVFDIGIFTHGTMFGEYASILIIAVITALAPVIQTTYRANNYAQMRRIFYLSEFIAFFVIFTLSLWMREIYQILIRNESLQIAHNVASMTCFSLCMYPLYSILVTIASIEKKTLQILWLVFFPAILSVFLNILFIPTFGYNACVVVMLISYWMISVIALLVPFYKKVLRLWFGNPYKILFLPVVSLSFLLLAQLLGGISIINKSIAYFIIVLSLLLFLFVNRAKVLAFKLEHD